MFHACWMLEATALPGTHHQATTSHWPTQNNDSRKRNPLGVLTRAAMEPSSPFQGTQEHNPLTVQTEKWSRRLRKRMKRGFS